MLRAIVVVIIALGWYIFCQVMSTKSRRTVWPDRASFPTGKSDFWSWAAPIGAILILGSAMIWVFVTGRAA